MFDLFPRRAGSAPDRIVFLLLARSLMLGISNLCKLSFASVRAAVGFIDFASLLGNMNISFFLAEKQILAFRALEHWLFLLLLVAEHVLFEVLFVQEKRTALITK